MKKSVSMMAIVALLFSMNVKAQEKIEKPKEKAKKECSAKEMKSCSKDKKGSCCAKKA